MLSRDSNRNLENFGLALTSCEIGGVRAGPALVINHAVRRVGSGAGKMTLSGVKINVMMSTCVHF